MHSAFVPALGSEIDRSRTNSIRRGLRPGELLRYDHCTDERPSEEHSSPLLWSDVKLIYCGSYKPHFRLEIECRFGKRRTAGEIIPYVDPQMAEMSHHCPVRCAFVSEEQLRLLMGHRHAISRVVETVYLSDHVPIDRLHSEQAREAAGRSLGIAAPAASTTVLANPRVAKVLQVSRKLREAVMLDRLLACKVPRLAVELINDDGWAEHLSNEQVSLVERLQEAETDFLSAFGRATGQLTSPTHAATASSHMQSQRRSASIDESTSLARGKYECVAHVASTS
ncbi:ran-binding protein RANBP1 and related RanBD domain proteins [Moesziomyces antarcticus T-34]|uniref:Ran-binding protein RANBP1 and related RanBD domain proteins n=1 Tax=Pseudozyma antarctica (strain T-34) TaxID=1151754 RepID=M9MCF0_PSEA3|nr:ran-binding protein RANBP1 and related RanBD domain proteins [Moesziomyces antarcticus T-34]